MKKKLLLFVASGIVFAACLIKTGGPGPSSGKQTPTNIAEDIRRLEYKIDARATKELHELLNDYKKIQHDEVRQSLRPKIGQIFNITSNATHEFQSLIGIWFYQSEIIALLKSELAECQERLANIAKLAAGNA